MTCRDTPRCPHSGLELAECIAWLCDCFADVDRDTVASEKREANRFTLDEGPAF